MSSSKNDEELLPDGWVLGQSKSNNGRKYYFNRKTGKSSWTRPEFKVEEKTSWDTKKGKVEKECKLTKRSSEEDKKCMKRKSDSYGDSPPANKVVKVSDVNTPNCSKTKIPISTPIKNSANKRLAELRTRLSEEALNEDSSSSSSKSSGKTRSDTSSPTKNNFDSQNRNHNKVNSDYTSPCFSDSKCSTSQSPSSDSIHSIPSPSQFFTANKILSSMKSQLHEDVSAVKKDTFAEIEAGICSQTPDYSSIKHPATPPQFSEASKLVSAIKSKLAYKSNASREINEIEVYSTANDRLAALRKSLGDDITCDDGVKDDDFASKLIASVKRKYSIEAMEVDESKHLNQNSLPKGKQRGHSNKPSNNTSEDVVLVVDTNIFIHELDAIKIVLNSHIRGYEQQPTLIVPWRVINELDRLKDNNNGNSAICKRAKAAMDYLYQSLPENNRIKGQSLRDANSHIYPCELPDDEILNCCLQQAERGKSVILLSNDKNLCNKATINSVKSISLHDLKSQLEHRLPSSAHPELSDNMRHYEDCIYQLLSNILENEMRAKYNTLWQHVLFKAPPWNLRDVLHCLLKHWLAVFSEVFPRIEYLITELKNTLVRIDEKGRKSLTQIDVTNFKDLSLDIAKRCQIIPEYMDLAKSTVEKINKSNDQSTSHESKAESEKIEKAKELCIVQAFENVWTVFSSYCAKLASGLGITHNVDDNLEASEPQSVLINKWTPFSNQIHEFTDAIRGILSIEKESDPSLAEHIGRLESVFKVSLKLIAADESIVTAENLTLFATKCRNMLQEAFEKFTQLTELLDVCGSMLNQN